MVLVGAPAMSGLLFIFPPMQSHEFVVERRHDLTQAQFHDVLHRFQQRTGPEAM